MMWVFRLKRIIQRLQDDYVSLRMAVLRLTTVTEIILEKLEENEQEES